MKEGYNNRHQGNEEYHKNIFYKPILRPNLKSKRNG